MPRQRFAQNALDLSTVRGRSHVFKPVTVKVSLKSHRVQKTSLPVFRSTEVFCRSLWSVFLTIRTVSVFMKPTRPKNERLEKRCAAQQHLNFKKHVSRMPDWLENMVYENIIFT
jgi:hypothetical protein